MDSDLQKALEALYQCINGEIEYGEFRDRTIGIMLDRETTEETHKSFASPIEGLCADYCEGFCSWDLFRETLAERFLQSFSDGNCTVRYVMARA